MLTKLPERNGSSLTICGLHWLGYWGKIDQRKQTPPKFFSQNFPWPDHHAPESNQRQQASELEPEHEKLFVQMGFSSVTPGEISQPPDNDRPVFGLSVETRLSFNQSFTLFQLARLHPNLSVAKVRHCALSIRSVRAVLNSMPMNIYQTSYEDKKFAGVLRYDKPHVT